jgi:phosphoglycerate dehydrogenase-like enzyme/glyoxylase-like metal-dependent hydrolase (beta-lactamase superfamily II)
VAGNKNYPEHAMKFARNALIFFICLGASTFVWADEVPKLQFNEVKEVAPGVFFRYSAIGPEGSNIPFGGSNNIWIVFEDYVVVVDANFPKEAGDVIQAIKKTTDKPIRYVLDTHHHGDHSFGNAVFGDSGASIVAQANCAKILRVSGAKEFADAGKPPTGREDIAKSRLKVPSVVFDDKLVLDDGKQRVEFLFFGHAHTSGDAFAYLPKQKMVCTGDACVNGAFNFMGHSDSASWIRVLEKCQQLDVNLVLPGHGPPAAKELLEKQKRYFIELRQQVKKGIDAGQDFEDIKKSINMPWYKEWTTVDPAPANIEHVYGELTGRVTQWDLIEDFGLYEGPSPTKDSPGWTKPRRIVVPNVMPARLAELKRLAPEIEFIPVKTAEDAAKEAEDADAVVGFCSPEILKAGKKLRWIQVGHVGVEKDIFPELVSSQILLTNTQRLSGPPVADQAFALLLVLTREARNTVFGQSNGAPAKPTALPSELQGKTMLVIGLGGVGTQISRRAQAFGMRVMAIDPQQTERPPFVFSLNRPEKLNERLPQADVVVLACPLTNETRGLIGEEQLKAMKKTAYLINIARGGVVQTPALVSALESKTIAGAGMDVSDPEPLPEGHPLLKMTNVVISPHIGARSAGTADRQWRLFRENIRRFVAGEALLGVVDKGKGF